MTPEPEGLSDRRAHAQDTLIDFLFADLDLCFTMLDAAYITHDPEHRRLALDKVLAGIRVVRSLAERIENPEARQAVYDGANELEQAACRTERASGIKDR
jgi:hypothetical protein